MQKQKNKTMAILIVALLSISMATSITLLPANAHTPSISWQTLAFISASPNPCGQGQQVTLGFWLQQPPNTANGPYGDRWQGMTVKVTKPDGTNETLGPFTSDDTGGTFAIYTPTLLGNYSFQMFFPGQNLTNANPPPGGNTAGQPFVGDYFQPSQSNVATILVQETIIAYLPNAPLPTNYWTRPINAMNYNWFSVSGNWLGGPNGLYRVDSMYNPYTLGPESAHILWTKPESPGGTVGGDFGNDLTGNYYTNRQYEKPFMPIIMNGVLYYTQYPGSTGNPVGWVAVDLRTGQEIWRDDATNLGGGSPAQTALTSNGIVTGLYMGQVLNYVSPNQFGGFAYLWSSGTPNGTAVKSGSTTWNMFDAMTGMYILSIVNGSTMTVTRDEHNNLIGYYVNSTVSSAPTLNCWNSTQCVIVGSNGLTAWQWRPPQNGKIDFKNGIMWTAPLPTNLSGTSFSPAGALSIWTVVNTTVLMTSPSPAAGSFQGGFVIEGGFDTTTGAQLFLVNRTYVPNTRLTSGTSYSMTFGDGVYVQYNFNTFTAYGYDIRTGAQLWSTVLPNPNVYDMDIGCGAVANGTLYLLGLGGDIYALNVHTGAILWQQSTAAIQGSAESNTPYGVWPVWTRECSFTIADGKLYFGEGHEYSPPLFRGAREICLNATTGQPIWNVLLTAIESAQPISDGIMTTVNGYDNQIYAFGMGPSKTTVNTPNPVTTVGTPIVIQGTVTDISSGTNQNAVAANFPNGLPCVSDASQTQFMEAVYEQQPMPNNVTGVPITISVIDTNGNTRQIGSAISDAFGTFSLTWTPDIAGDYKVIASFAGSNSYYASSAASSFHAVEEHPTVTPQPAAEQAPVGTYIAGAAVGIIIAIAIATVIIVMMVRKRP
jgi:outer membrane protein assembly factor BamB